MAIKVERELGLVQMDGLPPDSVMKVVESKFDSYISIPNSLGNGKVALLNIIDINSVFSSGVTSFALSVGVDGLIYTAANIGSFSPEFSTHLRFRDKEWVITREDKPDDQARVIATGMLASDLSTLVRIDDLVAIHRPEEGPVLENITIDSALDAYESLCGLVSQAS